MKSNLRARIQLWAWRQFLRIGHDLVWKADEWFQAQEVVLQISVQPTSGAQGIARQARRAGALDRLGVNWIRDVLNREVAQAESELEQ